MFLYFIYIRYKIIVEIIKIKKKIILRKNLASYKNCRNRFFYIKLIKITRRTISRLFNISIERVFCRSLNNKYI